MYFPYPCEFAEVIAIGERAAGNDSVGNMWLETKTFPADAPVREIVLWAKEKDINGKLIITINERSC